MRVVIALGGNALLRRGQPMTEQNQRQKVKVAAWALARVARSQNRGDARQRPPGWAA